MEFTDVFEKVKEVELHTNPWTDLPPKWGKLWPKKKSTDAPLGYGIPEAVDFLYGMRAFYDVAEAVWQEKGAYHYTLRLGLQEFISDIKKRMPMSWHEGLVEYVKIVYFMARETGSYPRWYSLEGLPDVTAHIASRQMADSERRASNVRRVREEMQRKVQRMEAVYDDSTLRRAVQQRALRDELHMNDALLGDEAMETMRSVLQQREREAEQRRRHRENALQHRDEKEMSRLKDILAADAKVRSKADAGDIR